MGWHMTLHQLIYQQLKNNQVGEQDPLWVEGKRLLYKVWYRQSPQMNTLLRWVDTGSSNSLFMCQDEDENESEDELIGYGY